MWINSMQREEPYLGLTCTGRRQRCRFPCGLCAGGAWLSSARVARCWVKSRNERNPYFMLPARYGGDSGDAARGHPAEGGGGETVPTPRWPGGPPSLDGAA